MKGARSLEGSRCGRGFDGFEMEKHGKGDDRQVRLKKCKASQSVIDDSGGGFFEKPSGWMFTGCPRARRGASFRGRLFQWFDACFSSISEMTILLYESL